MIQLALIGNGIRQSRSPDLHQRLGRLIDRPVRYDIIEAREQPDFSLPQVVEQLRAEGYRGTNVTYPFKEQALKLAEHIGEGARRVGSTNTLIFEPTGIRAENTDFTGFISAWRYSFGDRSPGCVLQIGAGGVGRAVAHGLAQLNATSVLIADLDRQRAAALVAELRAHGASAEAIGAEELNSRLALADGVVNCSPIGHVDHPGCPIDPNGLRSEQWLFDAVYVPARTELIQAGEARNVEILSGVELFLFQGIDAFRFFIDDATVHTRVIQQTETLRQYYRQRLLDSAPGADGTTAAR